MSNLPLSPFLSAGAQASPMEEAAAPEPQMPSAGAAAAIPDLGTNCIGEIFVGAQKLEVFDADYLFELDPGNQKYRGMPKPRLHVARFMQELDEPPLFLRQVG